MIFLFLLFGAALGLHAAYWLLLHRGVHRAHQRDPSQQRSSAAGLPPLSVIVAARDEETNLPTLLAALRRQTHPCFEVIVADDASEDATPQLVREWIDALPEGVSGRLVTVQDPRPPRKKHALTQAIATARHPLLAFTDADCAPPPGWLASLARAHADGGSSRAGGESPPNEAPLLIGYSPYRKADRGALPARNALLNRFARYETFVAGVLTAGACGLDRPYMAVGRNISYSRMLFDRIGGFAHSARSMSGDDDLLVQEVQHRRAAPVRHVFGPETFVKTDAPSSWRSWLRQKRRHASAGRFYSPATSIHLTTFNLSGALLWLAPFVLGWTGLALLAAKMAVQGTVLSSAARLFDEQDLLSAFPLWGLGYALYNVLVVPLGLLRLPDEW